MSINIEKKQDCCGCEACKNICPVDCISMIEDEEGFQYPKIDERKCIHCNLCSLVCPIEKSKAASDYLYINELHKEIKAFACMNSSEETREKSSSGGIFSLLAEKVIQNGGRVYGAAFDEEGMVHHIGIGAEELLFELRGSKYLQSRMEDCFQEIKKVLEEGSPVLFSGTPCQNAGLKAFLQKDYEKLYYVDVICHGVPSPLVWKKYLESLEKRLGLRRNRESNPSFRSKTEGWIRFSVSIPFGLDTEYLETLDRNLYMKTFLSNLCLRPSCYECKFKPSYMISDITLADFWGVQKILPEMFDDKGTSLVIVNSDKGQQLFDNITDKMKYKEVLYQEAIKYNGCACQSVEIPEKRKEFFEGLNSENIEGLMKRLTKTSLYIKCRRKLGSIKRHIISYF